VLVVLVVAADNQLQPTTEKLVGVVVAAVVEEEH
jgi:hypothetical protein